jgi:methyl-accepting chemotaxis protein
MKTKILITLPFLSLIALYCTTTSINEYNVQKELSANAESIKKNRNSVYKLDSKTIGKNGYFYILRSTGKVSYHPKKALIDVDFSTFPFVKKILVERNGCIMMEMEGISRYIFFREIDKDEILCLTIDKNEFKEAVVNCY